MSVLSTPARLMVRPFRGSSTADRMLRANGWLGLVGVLLLRARKRRA